MTERLKRIPRYLLGGMSLSAGDGLVLADGSLWSHAATLGTRTKGTEFTIDQGVVQNFIKNFTSGYPQKIPVDYEHGSTTSDPEIRKLRAQGKVPKAGDVLELRGVFAPGDFTGDLKTAAEKLSTQAGRELTDPRNLGLWMRWKPTAQALGSIKAGEYTELSIAFDDDVPNNTDGAGQGPGLIAVALLNLPFLDDMLPVAASRHDDRDPADPGTTPKERETMKITMLSAVAAMLAKPVATEEDAITELAALTPQVTSMREYRNVVAAELEETDPVKAVAKIRELKSAVATATAAAAEQKKVAIKTVVETTMTKHEKKLTVPLKELMAANLATELEAGVKLEDTKTVKALETLKEFGQFTQSAGGDIGGANADDDVKLDARARELQESDPAIKALTMRDPHEGYKAALFKADRELRAATK